MAKAVPAVRDHDPSDTGRSARRIARGCSARRSARTSPQGWSRSTTRDPRRWSASRSHRHAPRPGRAPSPASCRCGPASASEARWQIASTAPVESVTPNRSRASSTIPRREIRCRAVNVTTAACNLGPNGRRGDQLRQPGAGPGATVPAAQLMGAMLGHDHADRRQLAHLVATEPPARPALLFIEPMPAAAARVRVVIDDLIDLILRLELATRAPMPGLPTQPCAARPPGASVPWPSRAPPPAAAPASWADPSTAAWSSCANPGAPAPPAASADPRAAQPGPPDSRMNSTHASRPES